jgi:hypothetical protein
MFKRSLVSHAHIMTSSVSRADKWYMYEYRSGTFFHPVTFGTRRGVVIVSGMHLKSH